MITALLAMAVIWCLFYGRIPPAPLALLCTGLGAPLAFLGRHKHTQFLTIDVHVQVSRLKAVNPGLKFWTALIVMALCVAAPSPVVGLFLTLAMPALTVCAGGLRLRDYVRLMALPVSFLLLSGLALLFEATAQPAGVLNIPVFGCWLSVSAGAQANAARVVACALGAVSCLHFLSLSTPMSEIIGVLRRAHCPNVLIELMYLIYRYIFILLSMYHTMRAAAKSRLGYVDYRTGIRTTGSLYSNLLARSYQQANKNFDAMESRCFDTDIRFLENREKITGLQVTIALGLTGFTLGLNLLLR